jgi:hypothetical protein
MAHWPLWQHMSNPAFYFQRLQEKGEYADITK